MNKSFSEFLDEAGFYQLPEIPMSTRIVYAYKNGEAKAFTTVQAAKAFSSVYETVYQSSEERDLIIEMRERTQNVAFKNWYASLRNYWSNLSDEVFSVCYERAYAAGHAEGYDNVRDCLNDIETFASELLKASEQSKSKL